MRHFLQIATGVDVQPLLLALYRQPRLWNQNRIRTTYPGTPHAEVDDILLRFQAPDSNVVDENETVWYPAIAALPEARALVFALMARVQGERLGRVLLTRLPPGKTIARHADAGSPAVYYERFHVSLQCPPEALFRAGDEVVWMAPGEAWWFNNQAEHQVWNEGETDRIVLIVDIRCARLT